MTQYTLNVLLWQKAKVEESLSHAKYTDETQFYANLLQEIQQDIEKLTKKEADRGDN